MDTQAQPHEAFAQPADPTIKVWRYMSLAKLLDLLRTGHLHFSNLRDQQDRYEGMDPPRFEEAHLLDATARHGATEARFATQALLTHMRAAADGLFINCWRAGRDESEAMWRLYCPSSEGVALQTTYSRLAQSVRHDPNCLIGLVKYIDPRTESFSAWNAYHRAMHKRASFEHEKEVRLVKRHSEHLGGGGAPPRFMRVAWEAEAHTERLFVHPYAAPWFIDVVRDAVGRYSVALAKRVDWSSMV